MNTPVYYSDLRILLQLFVPTLHSMTLQDSAKRLVLNSSFDNHLRIREAHPVLISTGKLDNMDLSQYETILDFGKNKPEGNWHSREYHYINNPDGTMRWLFPKNDLHSVTGFYAAITRRSRLYMRTLQLMAFLRLGKFFSHGKVTIYSKSALKLDTLLTDIPHNHYGIFMGTAGAERTVVCALRESGRTSHFVKVALNKLTANRVNEERRAITRLSFLDLQHTVLPQEFFLRQPELIVTSNVHTTQCTRTNQFSDVHANALVELHHKTALWQPVHETLFWNQTLSNLHEIRSVKGPVAINRILHLLRILKTEVAYDAEILTQAAFGDFTPWNHYINGDKLCVYDLEHAHAQAPFLYDVFHYHFQKGITTTNQHFRDIWQECLKACTLPAIRTLTERYDLNVHFYLKLYLMRISSEQLLLMQHQDELTANQLRQLVIWEQALKYVTDSESVESYRTSFMEDLRETLVQYPHAFIKFAAQSIDAVADASDLDIALEKNSLSALLTFIDHHSYIAKTIVRKKSYMTTVTCFFKDNGHLSIDLVHGFKRRNVEFMQIDHFLRSSQLNPFGIRVPELRFDMEYALCFYYLNHANVPAKYQEFFSSFPQSDKARALAYLNSKYGMEITTLEALFTERSTVAASIRHTLRRTQFTHVLQWFKNTLSYTHDLLNDSLRNRSLTITLSGVDGVGKTTVIRELTEQIRVHLRKDVVLLRHRPGILPILSSLKYGSVRKAEEVASVTKPGTGNNHNRFSSMMRFGYYFADYLLGQLIVFLKYKLRGKIVVYDRYYFDFINHPERSNIRLPKWFSKGLYRFIAKPDLNILLVADSAEILERKQELDAATIEQLSGAYQDLFEEFRHKYPKSQYFTIHNHTLEHTRLQLIDILQKVA